MTKMSDMALVLPAPVADATLLAGETIGAVAGTGGWFDSAPGTPAAPLLALLVDSSVCWLRIAALFGGWFGLNVSEVCSVCVKSMLAVTCARTFSAPSNGAMMFSIR